MSACSSLYLSHSSGPRSGPRPPPPGSTRNATVQDGKWAALEPETVEVPAAYAQAHGVWFRVRQGLRGLLVRTRAGEPVVYLVCEPSTRHYRVMTRAEW